MGYVVMVRTGGKVKGKGKGKGRWSGLGWAGWLAVLAGLGWLGWLGWGSGPGRVRARVGLRPGPGPWHRRCSAVAPPGPGRAQAGSGSVAPPLLRRGSAVAPHTQSGNRQNVEHPECRGSPIPRRQAAPKILRKPYAKIGLPPTSVYLVFFTQKNKNHLFHGKLPALDPGLSQKVIKIYPF